MKDEISIPEEIITHKIYLIRDQKIMLDRDLAQLYGVETRVLNQAVKRNIERFPKDFMFKLNKKEFENWRSQTVVSNSSDKMGLRRVPHALPKNGVARLSSVLKSKRAIEVNIKIIRVFTKIRQSLSENLNLKLKIEAIKKKLGNHDKNIELIFSYLDTLLTKKKKPTKRSKIGFKK